VIAAVRALSAEVINEMTKQINQVTGGYYRSVDVIIQRILELVQGNRQKLADGAVKIAYVSSLIRIYLSAPNPGADLSQKRLISQPALLLCAYRWGDDRALFVSQFFSGSCSDLPEIRHTS